MTEQNNQQQFDQNNQNNQNNQFNQQMNNFMPNSNEQFDPADIEANKAMGGLAYILFFVPLIAAPNSRYARFHANQGLMLVLLSIALSIVYSILTGLFLAMGAYGIFSILSVLFTLIWIAIGVFGIIGLINGFTGKVKELPIIGKIKIIK